MTQLPSQFGQYSLLKLLAKGGMGEIFLARTQGISHFEKYYAIKKLLQKFARDQDVGARFIDEAKLGARLQHPNIVQVYDLGAVGEELYMATEFVDGFDLRRVLRFCHEKKRRIPLDIALFIVREVLSGLSYAHRQLDAEGQSINLIHRDISPQNVLVSFEGEVKIIDFGLAKSTQRSQETQANVLLGNFGYMSPEQARGQKLDVRTDIYSAGIVLFELVTRTKRFVDENPLRLLEMVARPTPVMPSDRAPDVPKRIDGIYAQATAPNRDERFKDADVFRAAVTTALHKINPHASREHLAQFLNHLFLGGKPPPAPDNDALDKSVAMQVHEIYQQAEAFRRTKEQDAQDRRLSQFSDDAPQTGSHTLMRGCRVGDNLSHQDLTGEAPPTDLPQDPGVDAELAAANDPLGAPALSAHVNEQPAPDVASAPTSVYEAPEWAGQPTAVGNGPRGPDVQAKLQAQLDAQIAEQMSEQMSEAPAAAHDTLQAIPQPEPFAPQGMVTTPGADAFASSGALDLPPEAIFEEATAGDPVPPLPAGPALGQGAKLDPASRAPDPAAAHAMPNPASSPPSSTPVLDPASRPPDPAALAAQGEAAVVSTIVGPGHVDDTDEPTMVVDMESMAQPEFAAPSGEAMPAPGSHQNAFAVAASSESLIIDFDASDVDQSNSGASPPAPPALPGNALPGNVLPGNALPGNALPGNMAAGTNPQAPPAKPAVPLPGQGLPGQGAPESLPDPDAGPGIRPAAQVDAIRPAAALARRPKGRPVRDINPRKPRP